jgi:hypothetical protein
MKINYDEFEEQFDLVLKATGMLSDTEFKALLRKSYITGKPFCTTCCPVSNFFKHVIEKQFLHFFPRYDFSIAVDGQSIHIWARNNYSLSTVIFNQPLPTRIKEFVKEFDAGHLPEFRA